MTRLIIFTILIGSVVSSVSLPCPAEESSISANDFSATEARIVALEDELESLRSTSASVRYVTTCPNSNCKSAKPKFFFGTEVTFLRPYLSGARSSATATGGKWVDPSYATGLRYSAGYQHESGIGIRAQYFTMSHGADLASVFGGGSTGVNMDVIDAEITLHGVTHHWDMELSGGVRYGQLDFTGDGVVIFPGHLSFQGTGPTVALKARRQLGNSGLALFGSLRGSFLMGEIRNNQPTTGLARETIEDEITQVIDNQLGIAWLVSEGSGPCLEIRAAWETQFWLNDTIADDVYGIGTNVALSGPSIAVELKY